MNETPIVLVGEAVAGQKSQYQKAHDLTKQVQSLADVNGSSLISVGLICREFKNSADLFKSMGFHTYDAWRESTFKGKVTTAKTSLRIVDKILPLFTKDKVLEMGRVKAVAFCRLPESEQLKDTWRAWVIEEDSTTFKARVKAFIGGSDHREGFCNISIPAPISFRDETFNRVMELGRRTEATTDSFIVLEAALATYEQEIEQNIGVAQDPNAKCFYRVETSQAVRIAIKSAMMQAVRETGRDEDLVLLAALVKFNGIDKAVLEAMEGEHE